MARRSVSADVIAAAEAVSIGVASTHQMLSTILDATTGGFVTPVLLSFPSLVLATHQLCGGHSLLGFAAEQ